MLAAAEGGAALPPALRGQLAQLHGNLNKILATRIDALSTVDITSGKDAARARRKALVLRSEELIETVEIQVRRAHQAHLESGWQQVSRAPASGSLFPQLPGARRAPAVIDTAACEPRPTSVFPHVADQTLR